MRAALQSVIASALLITACSAERIQEPTLVRTAAAHGAIRPSPEWTFQSIDVDGAIATNAQGINAGGEIVGLYVANGRQHGFVLRNGEVTTIDFPNAARTDARGIGPSGEIVGGYANAGEPPINTHGYLLTRQGEFIPVNYPNHTNTIPQRILPDGMILGCRHDNDTMASMKGVTFTRTGSSEISAFASMNNGATPSGRLVVGLYTNMEAGNRQEGYVIDDGVFTPFVVPGSNLTAAWDVNPQGDIVGAYRNSSGIHGFLRRGDDYFTIDYPGASTTRAFGINAGGDVVGAYVMNGVTHGFLATRR